jgi:hypothetical protein
MISFLLGFAVMEQPMGPFPLAARLHPLLLATMQQGYRLKERTTGPWHLEI